MYNNDYFIRNKYQKILPLKALKKLFSWVNPRIKFMWPTCEFRMLSDLVLKVEVLMYQTYGKCNYCNYLFSLVSTVDHCLL